MVVPGLISSEAPHLKRVLLISKHSRNSNQFRPIHDLLRGVRNQLSLKHASNSNDIGCFLSWGTVALKRFDEHPPFFGNGTDLCPES